MPDTLDAVGGTTAGNPQTIEVLFEGGIAVHPSAAGFRLMHVPGASCPEFPSIPSVGEALGIRPVVLVQEYDHGHRVELLLCRDQQEVYELLITDLEQRAIKARLDFLKVRQVVYALQSLAYHCIELSRAYSNTCADFVAVPSALLEAHEPVVTYQGRIDAYLEFDALVTGARRAYDSLRYLLWKYFGPESGSVPRSFARTLSACTSLPDALAARLASSWDVYGEPVTAYRDCIQHYCPVGLGVTTMWMTRTPVGVWSTSARIPDNPSARAQQGFTYGRKLDALAFGWEAATEILDVAALIVDTAVEITASKSGGTQRV
jgi:hypothetical protein